MTSAARAGAASAPPSACATTHCGSSSGRSWPAHGCDRSGRSQARPARASSAGHQPVAAPSQHQQRHRRRARRRAVARRRQQLAQRIAARAPARLPAMRRPAAEHVGVPRGRALVRRQHRGARARSGGRPGTSRRSSAGSWRGRRRCQNGAWPRSAGVDQHAAGQLVRAPARPVQRHHRAQRQRHQHVRRPAAAPAAAPRQRCAMPATLAGLRSRVQRSPLPGRSSASTASPAPQRALQHVGEVAPVARLARQPAQQHPGASSRRPPYQRASAAPRACALALARPAGSHARGPPAARTRKSNSGRWRRSTRCWRWADQRIEDAVRARTAGAGSS